MKSRRKGILHMRERINQKPRNSNYIFFPRSSVQCFIIPPLYLRYQSLRIKDSEGRLLYFESEAPDTGNSNSIGGIETASGGGHNAQKSGLNSEGIIALAIGIPSVIVGFITLYYMKRRRETNDQKKAQTRKIAVESTHYGSTCKIHICHSTCMYPTLSHKVHHQVTAPFKSSTTLYIDILAIKEFSESHISLIRSFFAR